MPLYPLKIFEIQNYNQSKPKFSGAYSRNNFHKTKDGGKCNKS